MSKHPAHYVGASTNERSEGDFYETPESATLALLEQLKLELPDQWLARDAVWEPAAGKGAIASVLRANGLECFATDKFDRMPEETAFFSVDFFGAAAEKFAKRGNFKTIITNPPYRVKQDGKWISVEDWITRAFEFPSVEDVFLLLKTTALAGQARSLVMERHLWHVWQFRGRVAMLRDGVPQQNMIDFAWMWFRREESNGFATISWID